MSLSGKVATLSLCLVFCACSKPKTKAHRGLAASASAEAPAAALPADSGRANPVLYGHVQVARESLVPPPLSAPADAVGGPGNVKMQVLRAGTGDSPGQVDTVVLDFSMWTQAGTLAMSSYLQAEPASFSLSSLPVELRGMLTQLKVGSKARYWLPRASLATWKPSDWPDGDLIFELELLGVSHITVTNTHGDAINPMPSQAPDAAGPPKDAETTPSGLHYIYLARGENGRHPAPKDRLELILTAYAIDGIVPRTIESGVKTATTLERAPVPLRELLARLSSGDRVRVWLPKGLGQLIVSGAGKGETIFDLALSFND